MRSFYTSSSSSFSIIVKQHPPCRHAVFPLPARSHRVVLCRGGPQGSVHLAVAARFPHAHARPRALRFPQAGPYLRIHRRQDRAQWLALQLRAGNPQHHRSNPGCAFQRSCGQAANGTEIPFDDGSVHTFCSRQRPQLFFSEVARDGVQHGRPLVLFSGKPPAIIAGIWVAFFQECQQ